MIATAILLNAGVALGTSLGVHLLPQPDAQVHLGVAQLPVLKGCTRHGAVILGK